MSTTGIGEYLQKLQLPQPQSHKGQNGKLLIIGGSDLFHAASKWSLDVASKFVDMVFYASVPSNNQLVAEAKGQFWNGIIVERTDIEGYLEEADAVLIGPGMTRGEFKEIDVKTAPTEAEWSHDTQKVTNYLLKKYPHKKWVIDAGALQMVDPDLLTDTMIVTPHHQELERLEGLVERVLHDSTATQQQRTSETSSQDAAIPRSVLQPFDYLLSKGITIVLKGSVDFVYSGKEVVEVSGGNPGMTKGGTGDVLAGVIAALYATNDKMTAAVVGSYANKLAGESLAQKVGPFFNASDLVQAVPEVLWKNLSNKD